MVKLDVVPRTLDDKVIRDGLSAVAALSNDSYAAGQYFVVGGIATQSYLPTNCRRKTSDIDLAVLRRLNREDFRRFSREARVFLADQGYNVGDRKSQSAFCLDFENGDDFSYLEFPRFSNKRFEEKLPSLERERKNAKIKIIEGTNKSYAVSSPEDIIVPKLVRAVNSLRRNPLYEEYVGEMDELDESSIRKKLRLIADLRIDAVLNPGDSGRSELLRFVADLYDVRILSELGGINPAYFEESVKGWDALKEPDYERGIISDAVLPDGFLDYHFTW